MAAMIEVDLQVFRSMQHDAERYRYLRGIKNWGEDEGNEWEILGELDNEEFDAFVDRRMTYGRQT